MMLLASSPFMATEARTARERSSEGRTREVQKGGFSRLPQMERFDRRLTPFTLGLCRANHNGPFAAIFTLSPGLRESLGNEVVRFNDVTQRSSSQRDDTKTASDCEEGREGGGGGTKN